METLEKIKYDLGFGDPVAVREALLCYTNSHIHLSKEHCGYEGGGTLLKSTENLTRELSKRLLGVEHKYIVITTGAMQAIDCMLHIYKSMGVSNVNTNNLYFPYYPKTIKKNGLTLNSKCHRNKSVLLLDSPSNPSGEISHTRFKNNAIWDAVYNNPIYKNVVTPPLPSEVAIGSFGKLFGLSGFRVGWLATDNAFIAEQMQELVNITTCGVPTPSQKLIIDIMFEDMSYWMDNFMIRARGYIDGNKEMISRISHIFDGQELPTNGMFYFPKATNAARDLLRRAGVDFIEGVDCGDKESIRLNLAQSNKLTKEAVQAILREDKV